MKDFLSVIQPLFRLPEETPARASFADIHAPVTFENSDAIIFGVPLDITTSFGKGTSRGPEAIRTTSAYQIETFVFDEKVDLKNVMNILDIGDIILPKTPRGIDKVEFVLSHLDRHIPNIVNQISQCRKIPIVFGGEHTISYFCLKGLAEVKPLLIHFDAHRDLKSEYYGKKLCHTTPFFRLIDEGYLKGNDIIQIGIRQADELEDIFAQQNDIITFDAWNIKNNVEQIVTRLSELTQNRKIYISFDIDVYDIQYVPCTGTPEPFGLDPFVIIKIVKAINNSADLIGMDMVEVSLRNEDYREGTLATQTLFRILTRKFVRRKRSHQ